MFGMVLHFWLEESHEGSVPLTSNLLPGRESPLSDTDKLTSSCNEDIITSLKSLV